VKHLRDIYIYNSEESPQQSEESPQQSEESLIKKSIQEYIKTYYCPLTSEQIYIELINVRNAMEEPKTIEEAMILLGQQWEDEEYNFSIPM
jgi:hypothetical protein